MAQVMLKDLNRKFDEVHAVKDVNLLIRDKEFIVLVGPSGCGKSTTLRMVAGLEDITSGEIYLGDQLVNNLPPKDRDMAMVFQNYALYPHMTVYDNMAFGLKMRKFPKADIEKRVSEAATLLGIPDLLKRKPRQLSGGQRQRVAVGRAIVRHPQVFLFDEPLSNLDAQLRVEMRREIRSLQRRLGMTMLYVTHDQVEAMTMADEVVLMRNGGVEQDAAQVRGRLHRLPGDELYGHDDHGSRRRALCGDHGAPCEGAARARGAAGLLQGAEHHARDSSGGSPGGEGQRRRRPLLRRRRGRGGALGI